MSSVVFGLGSETALVPLDIQTGPVVTIGSINDLNPAIVEAGPGGTVQIVGDLFIPLAYMITAGGTPEGKVLIKGGSFRSSRADPWTPGAAIGQPFFRLGPGASHLIFADMAFRNVGYGCFQVTGPNTDLTFTDITARNVQRFFETNASFGPTTASVTDTAFRNINVTAFTKGVIRLQYDSHDVLIEDVFGDSEHIDGDNFAVGVHFTGTVHDITLRRVRMLNSFDSLHPYWNGDGFASEENTYNHTYEDCEGSGCTDGGFDLKAANVVMVRCLAADNKRNYRLWDSAVLTDCVSQDPNLRGGSGTQAHMHPASNAVVTLHNFTATDCDPTTIVFDADQNATLNVETAQIIRHSQSELVTEEAGASVILGNVSDAFC